MALAYDGAIQRLIDAITEVKEKVRFCDICGNVCEASPCPVCADPRRDHSVICVVEEPKDVMSIERTREYLKEVDKTYADPNRGGVTVSIAGLTYEGAPHMRDDGAKPFYYYDLNGYQVSVYDLTVASSFRYWRTIEKDKTR